MPPIRKVLVANRGEIAVRLLRALREAGLQSVAIYSDLDRAAMHVRLADEAVHVGAAASAESYLHIDRIVSIARDREVDALHPGYGFLSENADFAEACQAAGIRFIGPSPESIRQMGSKTSARRIAASAGAPIVPGSTEGIRDQIDAKRFARKIGYPVMVKASAGGGGKGMRRVANEAELEGALRDASSEAEHAFRSGEIYIEKFIDTPRHVEIQILGDTHGHLIHLGERECSIQRRHQKVIEECPSPVMAVHPELRAEMGKAAIKVAKAANYYNAGTVEFLVDAERNFYFLEMNTRLQVEHPVTELVTGIDLVQWQLRIAAGERLTLKQEDIDWKGNALECRVYAEDPDNNFFPSPGKISTAALPHGPGTRVDSAIFAGASVPIEYDPLLAKISTHGETRAEAIARMARAMEECHVGGIKTNIAFFRELLQDEEFRCGRLHTGFINDFFRRRGQRDSETQRALVAALLTGMQKREAAPVQRLHSSQWLAEGRRSLLR